MNYDFDQIIDRRNSNSLKWDVADHELPMWVADMDFATADPVRKAVMKRAESGVYGYNIIPDAWYQAYIHWWQRRHHLEIKKEWLIFCTGVIPAISTAVKRMTNVGDSIVVQTPVYDMFFHSIENFGRHVLENPLKYQDGVYEMDFEDLEKKLSHPLTKMMILCNPQNPSGKIWSREELKRVGELCKKYHVLVLADEIHCDITDPGKEYVPFATVSDDCRENSITCLAATKAFNFAGLQTAAVMIPSEAVREVMERGLNSDEVAEPNTFAIDAVIAAFEEGEPWLEQLCSYIYENKKTVASYLKEYLPEITMVQSDATYLVWLDCRNVTENGKELCSFIRETTGLYLTAGKQYRGDGGYFMRMNLACPKSVVEKSLPMLAEGVHKYQEQICKMRE